jgi:hypothetical protein
MDKLQSVKTAPIVDSTISARLFGTSISPLECNGYSAISLVNSWICIKIGEKKYNIYNWIINKIIQTYYKKNKRKRADTSKDKIKKHNKKIPIIIFWEYFPASKINNLETTPPQT